jgi:2-amino-4-hydroxy-6-hydroxymethyldihydropteridine diphosphokinase
VQTYLQPLELLEKTQAIELQLGRQRLEKWGARTLDIDILYCGDLIMNDAKLVIPHPFLHQRKFTLQLLDELAPGFMHPVLEKTNSVLLFELENSAFG